MSVLAVIFTFVFSFLLTPKGFLAMGVGLLLFLGTPFASRISGIKSFANLPLYLAMYSVKRGAIVVSEHGDLLFKSMSFDDLGVETMSFGSETKEFEDPATALHHWMDFPFALADEVHGILFDPRHAAIGKRKHDAEEQNQLFVRATDREWDAYGVYGWVKGVFEFPDRHELVDLSMARAMVTGTERAEYPQRIEKMYELSREPYKSGTGITKFLMPVAALLVSFGGVWLVASKLGGGGGGGSTVGYGSLLLGVGALGSARDSLSDVDWRAVVGIIAVVLPLPVIFLLLFVFVSPLLAIFAFVAMGMGYWFLPLMTPLLRMVGAEKLGRFYMLLGFLGYNKPVFEWTPRTYRLREASNLEDADEVKWYSLAGSFVGFTFTPDPDSWGGEVMDKSAIETRREAATDGGRPTTDIPAGHTRMPEMQRAVYAGYVPSKLKDGAYYLHSGISLSRFTDAAIGEKSLRRLLQAKEEHGGTGGINDKWVLRSTLAMGVLGFLSGVGLFFL